MRALRIAVLAVLLSGCASPSSPSIPVPTATVVTSSVTAPSPTEPNALRLLVLGDSIAIPEMGCGSCTGFDRQYATYLEGLTGRSVELDNQARPNAQIRDLQAVLDSEAAVQDAVAKADIVVVSIGYNNTPPWGPDLPCHTPPSLKDSDTWPAILAMTPKCIEATIALYGAELDDAYGRIEELAHGRPQVRVSLGAFNNLTDNPGGDGTITDVTPEDLAAAAMIFGSAMDQWNEADCAAATAHGFACADIHHAFNGPDGTASVEGLVNPADFVHPSEAGQAVIAELLQAIDVSLVTGN